MQIKVPHGFLFIGLSGEQKLAGPGRAIVPSSMDVPKVLLGDPINLFKAEGRDHLSHIGRHSQEDARGGGIRTQSVPREYQGDAHELHRA